MQSNTIISEEKPATPDYKIISSASMEKNYRYDYWSLKSNRILQLKTPWHGKGNSCFYVLDNLNPILQHPLTYSVSACDITLEDKKNYFLNLLPEGPILSEKNDAICDLSQEREFFYRAWQQVTDFAKQFENFFQFYYYRPYNHANTCIKLGANRYGIVILKSLEEKDFQLKRLDIFIYEQIYNDKNKCYEISFLDQQTLKINDAIKNDPGKRQIKCNSLSLNSFSVQISNTNYNYFVYYFNFIDNKFIFSNPEFIDLYSKAHYKNHISGKEIFPISADELFYTGDLQNFSFTKLNLKTHKKITTLLETYGERYVTTYPLQISFTHLNFLIYEFIDRDEKPSLFIYDVNDCSIQFLKFNLNNPTVTLMRNGFFILSENENLQIVEFPRLTEWLQLIDKVLTNELNTHITVNPLVDIVKNYVDIDVKSNRYRSIFNSRENIIPQVDSPERKKVGCCIL